MNESRVWVFEGRDVRISLEPCGMEGLMASTPGTPFPPAPPVEEWCIVFVDPDGAQTTARYDGDAVCVTELNEAEIRAAWAVARSQGSSNEH